MNRTSKWLLLALLLLILHMVMLVAVATPLGPSTRTYAFPYGSLEEREIIAFVLLEGVAAFLLLLGFGYTVLRDD